MSDSREVKIGRSMLIVEIEDKPYQVVLNQELMMLVVKCAQALSDGHMRVAKAEGIKFVDVPNKHEKEM
jgi:hypothetical protein